MTNSTLFDRAFVTERRPSRPHRLLIAVVAAGLLLAACGSDSSDAGDNGATSAAGAPGAEGAGESAGDCTATDQRLPEVEDRDLVALLPLPDALSDEDPYVDEFSIISGRTNRAADPEETVACIDQLLDEMGWEVVHRSDDGRVETANGHAFVASHTDLPGECVRVTAFAASGTSVERGDDGTRLEFHLVRNSQNCVF